MLAPQFITQVFRELFNLWKELGSHLTLYIYFEAVPLSWLTSWVQTHQAKVGHKGLLSSDMGGCLEVN